MNPSERLARILTKTVAIKEAKVFGSHVIVTTWSEDAARKVFRLLQSSGWTRLSIVKSIDHNKENRGTCLLPSSHNVWRVGGRLN